MVLSACTGYSICIIFASSKGFEKLEQRTPKKRGKVGLWKTQKAALGKGKRELKRHLWNPQLSVLLVTRYSNCC